MKTIEMVDTRNPIPPSISSGGLHGVLFGPLAGQPSGDISNSVKFNISGFLILQIAIVLLMVFFNTMMAIGSLVTKDVFTPLEKAIHILLLPFSAYTFACLLTKYHRARIITLLYFSIMSTYYSIITIAIMLNHGLNEVYTEGEIGLFACVIFISIVSILYMYFSKRVLLTFSQSSTSA